MKYFTPELLERFGSEDATIAEAALEEWEETCARYNAYVDSVKESMPPGLRRIQESYHLHDAKIRVMGEQGRSFAIVLQLDTPPHSLVSFTFDLTDKPAMHPTALPRDLCSTGEVVEWQYDELERVEGEPTTWSWSMLLSNGWEVRLSFRSVQVQEVQPWIPTLPNTHAAAVTAAVSQPAS